MNKSITILVGNGLGMAIDPEYFKLEKGMEVAWGEMEKGENISEFKKAMELFSGNKKPETEKDLFKIHEILITLLKIESLSKKIPKEIMETIHPGAQNFNASYREYILRIARHFYNYKLKPNFKIYNKDGEPQLQPRFFSCFMDQLCKLMRDHHTDGCRVHIATLNYDALLYRAFIENGIMDDKILVDALTDSGFNEYLLMKQSSSRYLHLHGSPLFFTDDDDRIKKDTAKIDRSVCEPFMIDSRFRPHLVLCHPDQKMEYIDYSRLLSTYFRYFEKSLDESNCLIVIGYSGEDIHVNKMIKERRENVKNNPFSIKTVEYKNPNDVGTNRKLFWEKKLGGDVFYEAFSSILDYHLSLPII